MCVLLPNLGGRVLIQDHRIELAMAQQPITEQSVPDVPGEPDRLDPTELATLRAVHPAPVPQVRVRRYVIHKVAVVEVVGRLDEVVTEVEQAIQMALAERSHGVVCDLSAALGCTEPTAVEVLAAAGRHVRDWPGAPVAIACPDRPTREALHAGALGRHLIVTESLLSAMSAVLATRTLTVEHQWMAPRPNASQTGQDFVASTLSRWRLDQVIPQACLVAGELVAIAATDATTDVDLSIVWDLGALRLSVRDNGPDLPHKPYSHLDPQGRRLSVVALVSRAFGVLPTADGGKVVWAVLEAPRPRPATSAE